VFTVWVHVFGPSGYGDTVVEKDCRSHSPRLLKLKRQIALALVIWMLAWLLWSGLYMPLLIILGALSCLLTVWLGWRMDFFEQDFFRPRRLLRLLPFWGWLGKELIRSNLQVARIVLSPSLPISPTLVTLQALPQDDLGQAILGNAITLTPGTLTIDDHEGQLLVHCLTSDVADELAAGEMNRRVAAVMEKG